MQKKKQNLVQGFFKHQNNDYWKNPLMLTYKQHTDYNSVCEKILGFKTLSLMLKNSIFFLK